MYKNIFESPAVDGFIRTCDEGWRQGWHERNGGNLTYRMTDSEAHECKPFFNETPGEWTPMGVKAENLSEEFFITTGSGRYFSNVKRDPMTTMGIVEINKDGDSWRIVWGLEGSRPTSEFPSHFMNHSVRKAATNGAARVIYHAHTPYLVAMTFILPLTDRDITRALWQSETECPIIFPDGVGVVPWMVPGGAEIAVATSELMKKYDAAVWAHHGTFCSGPDFDTTFGLMHTIEKAAQIYVLARAAGQGKFLQSIPDDGIREVGKAFHVKVNEDFLD